MREITARRTVLLSAALMAGLLLLNGGAVHSRTLSPTTRPTAPEQAWARLREGNRRWAAGEAVHPHQGVARRAELAQAQEPYAVVVSCIDSRVAPELIFDAGLGDLFAVRSAAQTIDPLVSGAIEYGPAELDTPLIVVLGHQRCGAVTAAAHALREGATLPGNLQRIVSALRPAYERARGDVDTMIRINTANVVADLKTDRLLAPRLARHELKIVGAYYSLDTGQVSRVV